MKTVTIPNTNLELSRFIFGTARLFNGGGFRQRQELLFAAVDAGFTHFDTAPYYGFGVVESDLCSVFKEHRDVTFTTKVGIYSPGGETQSDVVVFLRKAIGRLIKPVSRPIIDFSVTRARLAHEGSLRRTGRETVDIYTLHEPLLTLVATDEWRRWLEACVADGKVRYFGLALTADKLEPFLACNADLGGVIQLCDSLDEREADMLGHYGRPLQITYGYVSAALRKNPKVSVAEVLKRALQRNHDGAVIVSSSKVRRLPQYARIAQEVNGDQ